MRPPTLADLTAVYGVIAARDTADVGAPDFTLADLRDEWRLPEIDLAADAQLAEDGAGRIVAYAIVRPQGSLAMVAPQAEGRGIGSQLLGWVERREDELRRSRHRQLVAASNRSAERILTSGGYSLARSIFRMSARLDGELPRHAAPDGIRLRGLEVVADGPGIHATDARSFKLDPGYVPERFESFHNEHLAAHDLDPALSVVAEREGRIAGFLLARRWAEERIGYVDILAVDPDEQRRGLGKALLSRAFAGFAAVGLTRAELGVASDNPRAQRLYESIGMRPRFRYDVYERPSSR